MITSIVFFIVSYSFLFSSIYFLKRADKRFFLSILIFLSIIITSILSILHYIAAVFYGSTDYDAIFFHIKYGLEGADLLDYSTDIAICCAILLANVFLVLFLLFRKTKSNTQRPRSSHKLQISLGCISLLLFFVFNPSVKSIAQYVKSSVGATKENNTPFYKEYQTKVSSIPKKPLNLIYIYLESFERVYFDKSQYPNLLPGLEKIENNSISFTNITQTTGAGWTIAGMVASQCGIPLFAGAGPNGTKNYDKFMPDAVCVGDILKRTGYNLSYLGGSSLDFTGKGNFYRDHGFNNIQGRKALKLKYTDKKDYSRWGLDDDKLLDEAYHEYNLLSAEKKPFGIFLLTLGTHNPGYPSKTCGEECNYGEGEDTLLNTVKCTDKLVTSFVKKIRASKQSANTIIVIGSDHLSMGKRHKGKKRRRNLFLVNVPNIQPEFVSKPGSTLDIAATLLNLLGFSDVQKFGFGVNLLQDKPTLIESNNNSNKFLKSWTKDIVALWSPPKFEDKLSISTTSKEAVLGNRVLNIPVTLTFSPELETERVIYESGTPRRTHHYFISKFSPETEFMYIDTCNKTSILIKNSKFKRGDKYCLALGSLGSRITEFELDKANKFSVKKLKNILVKNSNNKNNKDKNRINRSATYAKFDIPEITNINISFSQSHLQKTIEIKSTGEPKVERSFIRTYNKRRSHNKYLTTGIYLCGVTNDLNIKKLAHFNPLKNKSGVRDLPLFHKIIKKYEKSFSTYFIVVHSTDKEKNGREKLSYILQSLPLKKVDNINFKHSYIAVIHQGKVIYEKVGNKKESIACNLQNSLTLKYYKKENLK